jgi:putative tryptophan/tyrosine transport system substrate-binding protein
MPAVGFLHSLSPESIPSLVAAFRKGLRESGYDEGRNVSIEYRWAETHLDRLPALAADLVRRHVAVIVTPGNRPALEAAKAATTTIPIVFSFGANPVQLGLVASFSRPGSNVTGFSEMATELAPKRLGIMHELLPGAMRYVLLVETNSAAPPSVIADLQTAASAIGLQVEVIYVSGTRPRCRPCELCAKSGRCNPGQSQFHIL